MKKTKLNSFLSPSNGTVTLWEVNSKAQGPGEIDVRYFLITSADHKVTRTGNRKDYIVNVYNSLRRDAVQLNNGAW
tara:strand:- start:2290 stop:2517 length:228 start_codon:yes stop_codon:yes gene_type:complete